MKKQTKQQLRRQLINEHLPYEVYAYATARYYGQLQELGAIDVVEIMMHIEDIDEKEAIARCLQMLKDLQSKRADFVAILDELLAPDPLVEQMKATVNSYHKNN